MRENTANPTDTVPVEEVEGLPSAYLVLPEGVLVRKGAPAEVRARACAIWVLEREGRPFDRREILALAEKITG